MKKLLEVEKIIKTSFAISPIKGETLYEYIQKELKESNVVEINFKGITNVTTAFLNRAIGNLYQEYSKEYLEKNIKYKNLDELDKLLLNRVKSNAALSEKDKSDLIKKINEVISDE